MISLKDERLTCRTCGCNAKYKQWELPRYVSDEALKAAYLRLAEDYIDHIWRFNPNCWDTLDDLEKIIASLTGKSENEVSRIYAAKAPKTRLEARNRYLAGSPPNEPPDNDREVLMRREDGTHYTGSFGPCVRWFEIPKGE